MSPRRAGDRCSRAEDAIVRRVLAEMASRGWSDIDVAHEMTVAGCPTRQSTAWKIIHGEPRRKILIEEALALAVAFGTTVEDLASGAEAAQVGVGVVLDRAIRDLKRVRAVVALPTDPLVAYGQRIVADMARGVALHQ